MRVDGASVKRSSPFWARRSYRAFRPGERLDVDTMFTGRVYPFPGSASGLPSAPALSVTGIDGPGGDFGGQ